MTTLTTESGQSIPARGSVWLLDDQRTQQELGSVITSMRDEPTPQARRLALLGKVARATLEERLVEALRDAFDDDLADLLIAGWRSHRGLVDAARRTLGSPGTEEVVKLAQHTVRVHETPSVDVQVDGIHVVTVDAEIELAFDVVEAVGVVRDGRLLEIKTQPITVDAELKVQDVPIAQKRARLNLSGRITFDPGIALTRPQSGARQT